MLVNLNISKNVMINNLTEDKGLREPSVLKGTRWVLGRVWGSNFPFLSDNIIFAIVAEHDSLQIKFFSYIGLISHLLMTYERTVLNFSLLNSITNHLIKNVIF